MRRLLLLLGLANIAITPAAIESHMRFLASDLLEGRETGTRGYDVAAEYVAAQFRAAGLSTSYQPVAFRTATLNESASSMSIDGAPLVVKRDVLLRADAPGEASAPVVFAGFGIAAPELHHDDYAGIDVRGKIVAMLSGAPPSFPNDQRAFYSSSENKRRAAGERGAIATITISTRTDEQRAPWAKRIAQRSMVAMAALDPSGKPLESSFGIRAQASLSLEAAARLFAHAPVPLEKVLDDAEHSVAHSFPLNAAAAIVTASHIGTAKSGNVIGVLRGSDPKLRDDYVVVSAHLDHLGNHNGIYHGALDNASGVACLIEIAKALRNSRRSVVFLALTGEEKGEQGSRYFAKYPTVRNVVADVNMDMFTMLFPVADVVILGGEHTTLGPLAQRAAIESGFTVSPDPLPAEVRFIRSDQFQFVREGIPAITLKAGIHSRDASIDGAAVTREWLRNVYHSPKDDMSRPLDFASGARYAMTNLRLVRAIANAGARPAWRPHDFFAPHH